MIENVIASRYASTQMQKIFSLKNRYRLERIFWVALLKQQQMYGLSVSDEIIKKYESHIDLVDLDSINTREKILKHDVKARIEEFNSLVDSEYIHLGMTSRDLTDNIELIQIRDALLIIKSEVENCLLVLGNLIEKYKNNLIVARTHNVPAQLTTIGKKFSDSAVEMMIHYNKLNYEIENLPLRGLKGATGTKQDFLSLFNGDQLNNMEKNLATFFGFSKILASCGQVYPRSIDNSFVSTLNLIVSAPSSLSISIRLLAGNNLITEGFAQNQVGSSAMPHKRNARISERISGLRSIINGLSVSALEISGNQWNEGDVSCSVTRRFLIPDIFFATEGLLLNFQFLLQNLEVNQDLIREEIEMHKIDLLSSAILNNLVSQGFGREEAHSAYKKLRNEGKLEFISNNEITLNGKKVGNVKLNLEEINQQIGKIKISLSQECTQIYQDIHSRFKRVIPSERSLDF